MSSGRTIAAIATPPSEGGVGIVRVSGPRALTATRPFALKLPDPVVPRHAHFTPFCDRHRKVLDEGLFLYFAGPHSFTGEDVVELQTHGSPRLLALLLEEILHTGDVELAQPGEFSRRAFLNGRMDLAQAEAVAELIAAKSEAAVRAAAAQLSGALGTRLEAVRRPLLELHADWEGVLNFPDEAEGAEEEGTRRLVALREQMQRLVAEAGRGALLRRSARVVLFGATNAGKSTLFNALAGATRALVDAEPGTTRDVLEAQVEWDGLAITLVDTAGIRESPSRLEALGIALTQQSLRDADLILHVVAPNHQREHGLSWSEPGKPSLTVLTMMDLRQGRVPPGELGVSAVTGTGLESLRQAVLDQLRGSSIPEAVSLISERSRLALERALGFLLSAEQALAASTLEAASGEVSLALETLAEVTGTDASSALLDEIFRRFCIGK